MVRIQAIIAVTALLSLTIPSAQAAEPITGEEWPELKGSHCAELHEEYAEDFESSYARRAAASKANFVVTETAPPGINLTPTADCVSGCDTLSSLTAGYELAADGIVSADSMWISNDRPYNHWLLIDFERYVEITGFVIYGANSVGLPIEDAFKGFAIQTSNYPIWIDQLVVHDDGLHPVRRYTLSEPVTAQTVRLFVWTAAEDKRARVVEFEVYGEDIQQSGVGNWWAFR